MPVIAEPVTDMYKGTSVVYPSQHAIILKYDFHFAKNGEWYYINSANDTVLFNGQKAVAEKKGERWRIVDAASGIIIEESRA